VSDCAHHTAARNADGRRLIIALGVTVVFMVVEIIGGVISGSLALVADAVHMSTDAFALGLAASAFWISKRPADRRLNFGYRRLQVLSGFVNGILLLVVIAWILIEAVSRLVNPQPVVWSTMLVVAVLGLFANGVAFLVLTQGNHDNINIRGALLHVIGDLLGSFAAVVAAIVIMATGWLRVDPVLSMLVAALIARSAISLVRDSAHILLEGAPADIDPDNLIANLKKDIREIEDIHKIQIWQLTPEHPRLTMHVAISRPDGAARTLGRIKTYLDKEYQGMESTIQIELKNHCPDGAWDDDHQHAGVVKTEGMAVSVGDDDLGEPVTTTLH